MLACVAEAGLETLCLKALEIPETDASDEAAVPHERDWFGGAALAALCRGALRNELWCKLSHPSGCYLHFGCDLHTHAGTPQASFEALAAVNGSGLDVESMRSPYLD